MRHSLEEGFSALGVVPRGFFVEGRNFFFAWPMFPGPAIEPGKATNRG